MAEVPKEFHVDTTKILEEAAHSVKVPAAVMPDTASTPLVEATKTLIEAAVERGVPETSKLKFIEIKDSGFAVNADSTKPHGIFKTQMVTPIAKHKI